MQVIALVGDVFVNRDNPAQVFDLCRPFVNDAAFWLANLEAPLTDDPGEEWEDGSARTPRGRAFRADPTAVAALHGLSAVGIANNHIMDFGVRGYLDTIAHLTEAGIGIAGGGRSDADARRPFVSTNGDLSIAFLAYTCIYRPIWGATETRPGMSVLAVHTSYEPTDRALEVPATPPRVRSFMDESAIARVREDVSLARSKADLVVVSVHWGVSDGNRSVVEYQRELGRELVDAGAEIVFGHHPHVLLPVEIYKGRPIFYSLGNFVFDKTAGWGYDLRSVLVRCYVRSGRIEKLGLVPTEVDNLRRPGPCGSETAREVLDILLSSTDEEALATIPAETSTREYLFAIRASV